MKNSEIAVCPFYKWKGGGCILCERGRAVLGGEKAARFWESFCTDLNRWDSCPIARRLMKRYEK